MKNGDRGLGDTIARITKATRIKDAVEAITSDCGCKRRQNKLNELFPYGRNNTKDSGGS
jgi:hypothetical protein